MDLIYANQNREDIGVLKDFTLDLAFGSDENDFSASVSQNNHVAEAGYYLYIQGTEYGGIVDSITSDTGAGEVTYAGRTWHGILNSKILAPDAGQDYLTVSGDANTILADLITRMGLAALFQADSTESGINIRNYQFPRYVAGYDGMVKMLGSAGAKLHMEYNGHNVVISAVPITDYAKTGVDNDQTALTVKKVKNTVNHLICLGSGELKNRMVVHLYADEDGNISRTQSLFGVDEYAETYDYSLADSEDELVKGGMERFRQLLQQNTLNVDFPESDDIYDIGDIVGATDHITGISISVPVTKKIVKIEGDYVTVDIQTDSQAAKAQISGTGTGYETPVKSVNGKTGNVELNAADVGAAPDGYGLGGNCVNCTNDSAKKCAFNETDAGPYYSSWAGITSLFGDGAHGMQLFTDVFTNTTAIRTKLNGTWNDWRGVYTSDRLGWEHRIYIAKGLIANSTFGNYDGYGVATIILFPNGIARIDYGYKMVGTPNTGSDKVRWGLNRDLLSNLTKCPTITPTNAAGTIMIYKPDGTIWQDRIDYCGTNQRIDQFWVPARIYLTNGADGAWQEETLAGARIMGTAYGTY